MLLEPRRWLCPQAAGWWGEGPPDETQDVRSSKPEEARGAAAPCLEHAFHMQRRTPGDWKQGGARVPEGLGGDFRDGAEGLWGADIFRVVTFS